MTTLPLPFPEQKVILSLCDYTGNWPQFYDAKDGYRVLSVDLKRGGM